MPAPKSIRRSDSSPHHARNADRVGANGFMNRRHERKVAILLKEHDFLRTQRRIIERAKDLNWRIYDLRHYQNTLPTGLTPDGILTDLLWDNPTLQKLRDRKCPIVRLGRFAHPKDNVYPAVVANLEAIARMAAEHFTERHFRHVGFLSYNRTAFHFKNLYRLFHARAIELGCQCHLLEFRPLSKTEMKLPFEEKNEIRDHELIEWLQKVPKPIGILGFNEHLAARICSRSLDAGLEVPEQVAILSCGDDPLVCECTPIQLSSLATAGPDEGDAAVELLQSLMDGDPAPKSTVLVTPKEITVRESTDVLATTSPEVAIAIRFMWDHLKESLSVEDIATAIDVPRRKLERAFRQQLGRGINAELLRRRLEYCCELLKTTDLPVVDIVPAIGFSSTAYLHKVFLRTFGMTPQKWRICYS